MNTLIVLSALILSFTQVLCVSIKVSAHNDFAQKVRSAMDFSVDPCEDFYQYACGGWMKNTTMTDDKSILVMADDAIVEASKQFYNKLFSDTSKLDTKLASFWTSCMNEGEIESKQHQQLLYHTIQEINSIASSFPQSLFKVMGKLHQSRYDVLFNLDVSVDSKIPEQYLAQLSQSGLQLPDKSYYQDTETVDRYTIHIKNMFDLYSLDNAHDRAVRVIAFEKHLASITIDNDELRDPIKTFNKMSVEELKVNTPSIHWEDYFVSVGINISEVNVITPKYFKSLDKIFTNKTLTPQHYIDYLLFSVIHSTSSYMNKVVNQETFEFYGKFLSGAKVQLERKVVCIKSTDESLGMLLSKYFVEGMFPGKSKQQVSNLVEKLLIQYNKTLSEAKWMDEATRERALKKLSLFSAMVGHPDKWPTYDSLQVDSHEYFTNKMQARLYQWKNTVNKIKNKKVDHEEWQMTPQTINAYYDPTLNQIVFPAGILQTPFFSSEQPLAYNYGGIGCAMGHEISHGFDDQGRLYDGTGKMEDWWTPKVASLFKEKAKCLSDQYSQFEPLPGVFLNGNLTLGENIADNAGTKSAYFAYREAAGSDADAKSVVPELTNSQLFYVAYAHSWCGKERDQVIKMRVKTDVHSPRKYRVIGVLQNDPYFSKLYSCAPKSYMNPSNKCVVF
ncbi:endothelin-converting enzyme [Acrasis kona]|uniref:Endothelin-converting enzyme n=1 Tax=Acrasis kona TaxID=1008807 RepID=A0AAW2ZQ69_9EUKA